MRIALCHPTYWPDVRRGSERVVHDLAVSLVDLGHEVTILTTHRRPTTVNFEEGVRVVRSWRPPGFAPMRWYESFVETVPALLWRLARERFDVVQAFHLASAWGAVRARRCGDPPVIFSFHGSINKEYLTVRRYRLEMLHQVIGRADALTALSPFAAESFARYLLVRPLVLPAGVVDGSFTQRGEPANAPTLLCAADLSDPRKRGDLLFEAFAALRAEVPAAQLVLAAGNDERTQVAGRAGIVSLPIRGTAALANAYSEAWVTVHPAIDEALGLVMIESLACGTPVVAARSGAAPSIVSSEAVGRLFEPDDRSSLLNGLRLGLELSSLGGTGPACRARASEFVWSRLVHLYDDLYAQVV